MVRAVYLECVSSQSTVDFLHAFKRFTARRGCPETVLSDNASQFVITEKILSVDWKFITPQAPWQGGFYERLVGLMKNSLKKAVGRLLLREVEFESLVVRTKSILNTRPLFQISDDSSVVLRPVDFLQPKVAMISRAENVAEGVEILGSRKKRNTLTELRRRFEKTEECLDKFWELWRTGYLNCLRERYQKGHRQGKCLSRRVPKVGEVVLLKDEDSPRGQWRLARIIELPRGAEGKIRTAKIFLSKDIILDRPINHLYPLEIGSEEKEEGEEMNKSEATVSCTLVGDERKCLFRMAEPISPREDDQEVAEVHENGIVPVNKPVENPVPAEDRQREPEGVASGNRPEA